MWKIKTLPKAAEAADLAACVWKRQALKAAGAELNIRYRITINLEKQTISKLRKESLIASLWIFIFTLPIWFVFCCLPYCHVGIMVFIMNGFPMEMLIHMFPPINCQISSWNWHICVSISISISNIFLKKFNTQLRICFYWLIEREEGKER